MKHIVANVKVWLTSDLMFKGKSSLGYTNLFSFNKYKKQDDIRVL